MLLNLHHSALQHNFVSIVCIQRRDILGSVRPPLSTRGGTRHKHRVKCQGWQFLPCPEFCSAFRRPAGGVRIMRALRVLLWASSVVPAGWVLCVLRRRHALRPRRAPEHTCTVVGHRVCELRRRRDDPRGRQRPLWVCRGLPDLLHPQALDDGPLRPSLRTSQPAGSAVLSPVEVDPCPSLVLIFRVAHWSNHLCRRPANWTKAKFNQLDEGIPDQGVKYRESMRRLDTTDKPMTPPESLKAKV